MDVTGAKMFARAQGHKVSEDPGLLAFCSILLSVSTRSEVIHGATKHGVRFVVGKRS